MRLYLPAVVADLAAPEISPRVASGVTTALTGALPEEDEEGLEHSAFLTAADLSALLLTAVDTGRPARRCVLAVDVAAPSWQAPPDDLAHLPSVLGILGPLPWQALVAIHLDEADVRDALDLMGHNEEAAWRELGERDLLWFDASERTVLAARTAAAGG
ncbi:DUF6912 family protein [Serinibacter salmoneus]|uniref:Uncharacterized protein n=1 Tax=Serinibacter salmoneus TaxID=556530 RepID=A0A2A9D1R2_9MICO|nr:hypothetical protein [Serinibacter salmoneus]PFG20321.1 hypothetical protein ATL40_1919 [Serinibacter salmoneus]